MYRRPRDRRAAARALALGAPRPANRPRPVVWLSRRCVSVGPTCRRFAIRSSSGPARPAPSSPMVAFESAADARSESNGRIVTVATISTTQAPKTAHAAVANHAFNILLTGISPIHSACNFTHINQSVSTEYRGVLCACRKLTMMRYFRICLGVDEFSAHQHQTRTDIAHSSFSWRSYCANTFSLVLWPRRAPNIRAKNTR